jgi:hypothetical protein
MNRPADTRQTARLLASDATPCFAHSEPYCVLCALTGPQSPPPPALHTEPRKPLQPWEY